MGELVQYQMFIYSFKLCILGLRPVFCFMSDSVRSLWVCGQNVLLSILFCFDVMLRLNAFDYWCGWWYLLVFFEWQMSKIFYSKSLCFDFMKCVIWPEIARTMQCLSFCCLLNINMINLMFSWFWKIILSINKKVVLLQTQIWGYNNRLTT